jgi:hypothetical protein
MGDHRELGDVVPGGCYRSAHEIGGKSKLKREQNPGREPDPDLPPLHLVGGFSEYRRHHSGKGLHSAEGNDEHGASLDEERDIARNRAELFFK